MPETTFIRDLVIIFGLSVAVVLVFHRLRLPTVVGFLVTGALIGPYGLNLIDNLERVEIFAEVGVALLLFTIGLEFSLARLAKIRAFALTGGALQVGLTVAITALVCLAFGLPIRYGVFWGFLLALSSTAIVLKILLERGELDSPHGRLSLAILIFQDLIVVPMMMIIPLLGGSMEEGLLKILQTLGLSLLLIATILIAARWVVPKALELVVRARSRELFVITILLICAASAWLSEESGLSLALGAFIAGLVISESEYSHQALADIMPLRDSFNSLFFVSIGMLLDVRLFLSGFPFILFLSAGVLLLKGGIISGVTFILGYPLRAAILVGLTLPQVGEFSFILAQVGHELRLLTDEGYRLFLVISVLTMIASPFLIHFGPKIAKRVESIGKLPAWAGTRIPPDLHLGNRPQKGHVIIVGYGLNGRNLARVLNEGDIPYVILDIHGETVKRGRAQGEPIFFGDGSQGILLRQMGIKNARVMVLAISDPGTARQAIRSARQENPLIHIVARTRYMKEVDKLLQAGANEVVPEEFETSLEIFGLVLQQFQLSRRHIFRKQNQVRREGYAMLRRNEAETYISQRGLPLEVEVEYHPLKDHSPFIGKTLADLHLPTETGVLVAAVIRRGETFPTPSSAFELRTGDTLVLTGTHREIEESIQYLDGPRPSQNPPPLLKKPPAFPI